MENKKTTKEEKIHNEKLVFSKDIFNIKKKNKTEKEKLFDEKLSPLGNLYYTINNEDFSDISDKEIEKLNILVGPSLKNLRAPNIEKLMKFLREQNVIKEKNKQREQLFDKFYLHKES